jgi:hypothetical protein
MMSWGMSTCMAWNGVEDWSLDPMSLSGAPTRAMGPAGCRAAAMMVFWVAAEVAMRGFEV